MDQLDERFSEIYEKIKEYIKKEEDLHLIAKSYYFAKLKHSGVLELVRTIHASPIRHGENISRP